MKPQVFAKIVTGLAMLIFLLSAGLLAAQNKDSAAISKLLTQIKSHAALAADDAATLESFTRNGVHFSTHGTQLNVIRGHINNLITDSNDMISLRHEGSPWQQNAIDRIEPLLTVMSSHLTATINHFNENRTQTPMREYRDYVVANQKLIENSYQLIKSYESYARSMAKADTLEKKLQLQSSYAEAENVEP